MFNAVPAIFGRAIRCGGCQVSFFVATSSRTVNSVTTLSSGPPSTSEVEAAALQVSPGNEAHLHAFETRALTTAVDEVNVSVAATDGFGLKNQGLDRAGQMAMVEEILSRRHNADPGEAAPSLSVTISCVWGCPFEGEVGVAQVADLVGRLGALGVAEIALADTLGVGDPWSVRAKVEAARRAAPDATLRLHFHDTRNTGVANAFAGIEAGVDVLDASVGGIGGCPFAPGATGNVATEDLVFMLERAGFATGYDLDALIGTARWIGEQIGRPAPSALSRAGRWPSG